MPPGRYGALSLDGDARRALRREAARRPGLRQRRLLRPRPVGDRPRSPATTRLGRGAAGDARRRDGELMAYRHAGFWQPMDTLRDKNQLESHLGDRAGAVEGVGVTAPLPSPDFWRGRRVLLTGHTGFKGSWTALWLKRLGARTTGFALPPDTDPSLFALAGVGADLEFALRRSARAGGGRRRRRRGRPRDRAALCRPAAGAPGASPIRSRRSPSTRSASPICSQALRDRPALKRILVVTSDKVYANRERGAALRRGRPARRQGPLLRLQGGGGNRRPRFAARLFRPARRDARRPRAAATSSAAATTPRTASSPTSSAPGRGRDGRGCACPARRGRGSTCSTASPAICSMSSAPTADAPRALNFGPDAGRAGHRRRADRRDARRARRASRNSTYDPMRSAIEMNSLSVDPSRARATLGWRNRLAERGGDSLDRRVARRVRLGDNRARRRRSTRSTPMARSRPPR